MDQTVAAEQVATTAHAGQTDKAGRPYLDHPRRVAAHVATTTNDPDAVAAAPAKGTPTTTGSPPTHSPGR